MSTQIISINGFDIQYNYDKNNESIKIITNDLSDSQMRGFILRVSVDYRRIKHLDLGISRNLTSLPDISGFRHLQSLYIQSPITSINELRGMDKLETLSIIGANITDSFGIEELNSLNNLKYLRIRNSHIASQNEPLPNTLRIIDVQDSTFITDADTLVRSPRIENDIHRSSNAVVYVNNIEVLGFGRLNMHRIGAYRNFLRDAGEVVYQQTEDIPGFPEFVNIQTYQNESGAGAGAGVGGRRKRRYRSKKSSRKTSKNMRGCGTLKKKRTTRKTRRQRHF
jgi:hypothetical protein